MNDEELIERIINLNYREFGAGVGNDLKRIIIKKEQKINQLQFNWNSLREWLKNKIDNFQDDVSEPILHEQMTVRVIYEYMENLDKMNELEGTNHEET